MSRTRWPKLLLILAATGIIALVLTFLLAPYLRGRVPDPVLRGPVAIIESRAPTHGFLGVTFDDAATPPTINHILQHGPAASAGLLPGDVLLALNDQPIPDYLTLLKLINTTAPAQVVRLTIRRGQAAQDLSVKLISYTDWAILKDRERSAPAAAPPAASQPTR